MMKFKYQREYDLLGVTCPPSDHVPKDMEPVFRWVFDYMEDVKNFQCQYHKNPKRFLNKDDVIKCKAMGLSFFNDLQGSVERFVELKLDIGDTVYSTLGTKVAKGVIKKSDGVNGNVERLGHFTHHPSNSARYEDSFKIVQKL